MRLEFLVIISTLFLNLTFGYLFQVSNEVICFTELSFFALGGFCFWVLITPKLKQLTLSLLEANLVQKRQIAIFSGMGIAVSLLNFLFCHLVVFGVMYFVFQCESPATNLLNASLTNNVIGNLLCFSTLTGLVVHHHASNGKQTIPTREQKEATPTAPQLTFLLLKQGSTSRKILITDIWYIQSSKNCVLIHTATRKFVKYQSLKSLLAMVPANTFLRVHRSTAVNSTYISELKSNHNGDGFIILKMELNCVLVEIIGICSLDKFTQLLRIFLLPL